MNVFSVLCQLVIMSVLLCSDGPSMTKGRERYSVLEGNSTALVCGRNVSSNPPATVIWTNPQNESFEKSDDRLIITNGRDIVLNISKARREDNGTWTCYVNVVVDELSHICGSENGSSRSLSHAVTVIVVSKLTDELVLVEMCFKFMIFFMQYVQVLHKMFLLWN